LIDDRLLVLAALIALIAVLYLSLYRLGLLPVVRE